MSQSEMTLHNKCCRMC